MFNSTSWPYEHLNNNININSIALTSDKDVKKYKKFYSPLKFNHRKG